MRGELEFFRKRWEAWESWEGTVECVECGIVLQFSPFFCAHVIGKGRYPQLRLVDENLIPLCFEHHRQYDQGDAYGMMIADWLANKRMKIMEEHIHTWEELWDLLYEDTVMRQYQFYATVLTKEDCFKLISTEINMTFKQVSITIDNLCIQGRLEKLTNGYKKVN